MDFQYYGANCVRINTKKASIVVDDNLSELGGKPVTKQGEIALFTSQLSEVLGGVGFVIDQPGEYEVSDVSIKGVSVRAHIDNPDQRNAIIYKIVADDIRVGVFGHVFPDISNEQLEALGMIDVLIIPVGGNGYTLDSVGALKLIKAIEPKIIIPTHYSEKGINYPVPQQTLEDALKGLSMEPSETLSKLKVKPGEFTENMKLIVLEKQ